MSTPKPSDDDLRRRIEAIHECLREGYTPRGISGGKGSAVQEAAKRLGLSDGALQSNVRRGMITVDWSLYRPVARDPVVTHDPPPPLPGDGLDKVIASLRKTPMSLAEIAAASGVTKGQALDAIEEAIAHGTNIHEAGGKWAIDKVASPQFNPTMLDYVSREDDTFLFGVTTDNHLASKQSRLDVLSSLYDEFVAAGVDRAFNCGNYLEGERDLNRYELVVHGLDGQIKYLCDNFPKRAGVTTYALSGDDHEAWWSQKTGLDIGRKVEQDMRDAGRTDWINAGFIEADFRLVNASTGVRSILRIVHPGGGSAYAISYKAQKYVESLEGGDKPAAVIFGHWHKMFHFNYRNVWCLGAGTTQDQSIFMRKGQMEAHVGGLIVKLKQDRNTGAIVKCNVDMLRYFNRGYYEADRWSYGGEVIQPKRSLGGV